MAPIRSRRRMTDDVAVVYACLPFLRFEILHVCVYVQLCHSLELFSVYSLLLVFFSNISFLHLARRVEMMSVATSPRPYVLLVSDFDT